jgi:hypothetical protein
MKTYRLIRKSRKNHYFWLENETKRLVIGDHSCDDGFDEPTHPENCDDGILYVNCDSIIDNGLKMNDLGYYYCPVQNVKGEPFHTISGCDEASWLIDYVKCL